MRTTWYVFTHMHIVGMRTALQSTCLMKLICTQTCENCDTLYRHVHAGLQRTVKQETGESYTDIRRVSLSHTLAYRHCFFVQSCKEGTEDCEGIGREMERVAERMGGTTKWPYNDSDCLDAVSKPQASKQSRWCNIGFIMSCAVNLQVVCGLVQCGGNYDFACKAGFHSRRSSSLLRITLSRTRQCPHLSCLALARQSEQEST